VAALMRKVLHSRPPNATHWSVRTVAADTGISKSTVARYFALFGLQPHRSKSFKLSTDPFFVEKVRDVVGLYLNPPTRPWCCAWTKSRKSNRWSVLNRCCRWVSATLKG
jgi:putative transposase